MSDLTRKMLHKIREGVEKTKVNKVKPLIINEEYVEKDNFLTRSKILMEEAEGIQQKKN